MSRSRAPILALLAANTLSFMAEAVAMVAIPWFVLELTGSYARMGLIGFFTVLPRVIATFLGGQVVDRLGFRASSILSDLLSGLSVCGIPILYATDNLTFTWLVVLVIAGAFFDGPGATAKDAMVPELAAMSDIDLDRVNAFFQGARRLSLFIGPVTAGVLVAWVGSSNVLWVNAVVFALSALVSLAFIPAVARPTPHADDPTSFRENMLFGFRFIRRHRLMLWLSGTVGVMNLLDAPLATVQLPALVRENYGSAERLGILLGADGAGSVVGALVYSALAPRLSRRRTFIAGFGVVGLAFLVLASAPAYPVAVGAMVVMGLAGGPLNPILMSIRQEIVPMAYRARVFGTLVAIAFVAIPLGQLAGGYLIEWLGVQAVIAGVAVVYLLAVLSMLLNPVLHEMDHRPRPRNKPYASSGVGSDQRA
ncbi:MAG: MFS transporter [Thermomicrobiales bacterium]|nr:MFS transporter [Thermomicrobiales bacterium]